MRNSNTQSNRSGFTILEMMVTIGILVVVTVGVATIFRSIGETVDKGRKVSELNQFAARLERIMRSDLEAMTRDGFLVIVNKNANQGNDVPLYRGEKTDIDNSLYPGFSDEPGRVRRNDEIMFFANGDFQSNRPSIAPGMVARSNEASIYYGIGQKRRPQTSSSDPAYNDPDNLFFNPAPWDNNFDSALDTRPGHHTPGFVNPNEFARDWSLIRHVTLLVNPNRSGQTVPAEIFGLDRRVQSDRWYLEDSRRQIALQPAGRSIFRSLGGTDFAQGADTFPHWLSDHRGNSNNNGDISSAYPFDRASGMVDIVTEDLSTIRSMMQALPVGVDPTLYYQHDQFSPPPSGNPIRIDRDSFEQDYWGDQGTKPKPSDALEFNAGEPPAGRALRWGSGDQAHLNRMRRWMMDALPSKWNLSQRINRGDFTADQFLSGIRYEDVPTRLLFEDSEFAPGNDTDELIRAYAEANQEMLGASVFIPRCTEFIVEWSYGYVNQSITDVTDPEYKKMLWYGLDRKIDSNRDGLLTAADQEAASSYETRENRLEAGFDFSTDPDTQRTLGMSEELVVGVGIQNAIDRPDLVEVAAFGYRTNSVPPAAGQTEPDATWVWPRYIRITMSLGDPSDRDVEETYQIIFELPETTQ